MTSNTPHPSVRNPEGAKRPAALCATIAPPTMRAWITSMLFALCMGIVPVEGWAACTLSGVTTPTYNGAVVAYFPAFSANVDANKSVGAVLYSTGNKNLSQTSGTYSCSDYPFRLYNRGTTGIPTADKIYPTTISGIGMKISYGSYTFPYDTGPYNSSSSAGNMNWMGGMYFNIQLIKTGPITAGGTLTGEFAATFAKGSSGIETQIASYMFTGGAEITANVPTCAVATSSIAVDMGTVAAGDFQGIGANAGVRQNFDIDLSCSGGAAGSFTNVHITLTDNNDFGNTSDVLSLTPGTAAASGIGLNIFKGSTTEKVKFGPDSSAAGNPNQWLAGQVDVGTTSFSIPLSAQYVQTGPTVTGGTANATATFTMSYQ